MKINYPLLALAIGAFGIGTTEFSPMGLLPVIARGVDVSIPAAGMLISAYAVGVIDAFTYFDQPESRSIFWFGFSRGRKRGAKT